MTDRIKDGKKVRRARGIESVQAWMVKCPIRAGGERMKSKPKKPSGKMGALSIGPAGFRFESIPWPAVKDQLEDFVLTAAIRSAREAGTNLYELEQDPVRNPEQDFDFTIHTRAGIQYLDLMEIAPLRDVRGPHEKVPANYVVGEMADAIWDELDRKSSKYAANLLPVHLLIYPTDWRFRISRSVTDILGYWSCIRAHSFASIVYFAFDDATSGELVKIAPRPAEDFAGFDESRIRASVIVMANLADARPQPNKP